MSSQVPYHHYIDLLGNLVKKLRATIKLPQVSFTLINYVVTGGENLNRLRG